MTPQPDIILFGTKSPLTIDYEETVRRTGITLLAAVSRDDTNRLWRRDKLMSLGDCTARFPGAAFVPCAFAPGNRQSLRDQALEAGFTPHPGLLDPTAIIASSTRLGQGAFVNAGAVIGGLCVLGDYALVNRSANIGHHSFVDDFVSIGPGVTIAGNVRIGAHVTVGAGAVILPDVRIGEGAVIAAGSVVRRNVAADTLVSGNPAKVSRLSPSKTVLRQNRQE